MNSFVNTFQQAIASNDGYLLASIISPTNDINQLLPFYQSANTFSIGSELRQAFKQIRLNSNEKEAWIELFTTYWEAVGEIITVTQDGNKNWSKVYNSWKDLLNVMHKCYSQSHFQAWTLPLLYTITLNLRIFAIRADNQVSSTSTLTLQTSSLDDMADPSVSNRNLEDSARQINRIFALVSQDRDPPPNRKYATYFIAILLFKTYFRLNSISLCKNITRSISVSNDIPPLIVFPKSHQIGYMYYIGVVAFLDERYEEAEKNLSSAWDLCIVGDKGKKQAERILMYLVPTKIITKHVLPTNKLLNRYEKLKNIIGPLCDAIKKGNLKGFDEAMIRGEDEFVKMRIYLTLERGRDVVLRNVLRKVYLSAGYEISTQDGGDDKVRKSRISIDEFKAGLKVAGEDVSIEECEAMIAGMIYKNLMKGYISRAHSMVVLNKKGAFPGTGV